MPGYRALNPSKGRAQVTTGLQRNTEPMSMAEGTDNTDADIKRAEALIADDPVPKQEPTPQPVETPAPVEETPPVQTQAEPDADEAKAKPTQEGTPNKALQQAQQDIGALERKLDAVLAKQDRGDELTAKEKKVIEQAPSRIEQLQTLLNGGGERQFDVVEDVEEVARAAIETDGKVSKLQKRLDAVDEEIEASKKERVWSSVRAKFPGVDVTGIWDKAYEEAEKKFARLKNVEGYGEFVRTEATELLHARASAALKSISAKSNGSAPNPAPLTPGAALTRVQTGVARQPESPTEAYHKQAISLIAD